MGQIERDERSLRLEYGVREYKVRCFRVALQLSASYQRLRWTGLIRRSVLYQSVSSELNVCRSTYVELSIRCPIAKAFALALDFAHRRISEASTNRSSHYR
jgi:hypothetical protein